MSETTEAAEPVKEKPTDAFFRPLNDGRVEITCKAPGYRVRVSAPENEAWQVVELFESWTGLRIACEGRPKRTYQPDPGQLSIMDELEMERSE
jgi:hypothetical protein